MGKRDRREEDALLPPISSCSSLVVPWLEKRRQEKGKG
jgi:hypothetical protein